MWCDLAGPVPHGPPYHSSCCSSTGLPSAPNTPRPFPPLKVYTYCPLYAELTFSALWIADLVSSFRSQLQSILRDLPCRPPSKQLLQRIAITKYLVHIFIALLTGLANPPHEDRGTPSALCTPCVQCLAEFLV